MHKTVITQQQMDNLKLLAEVIEAKLGQPESVLNDLFQPCGTCGCIAGDFLLRKSGAKHKSEIPLNTLGLISFFSENLNINTFGHSMSDGIISMFGGTFDGTIQQRLDYVNKLIANSVVSGEDKAKAFIASLNQLPALEHEHE